MQEEGRIREDWQKSITEILQVEFASPQKQIWRASWPVQELDLYCGPSCSHMPVVPKLTAVTYHCCQLQAEHICYDSLHASEVVEPGWHAHIPSKHLLLDLTRGPAAIPSISYDSCSYSIAKLCCAFFMVYVAIVARYVAKWGLAQMRLCENKQFREGGDSHFLGDY